MFRKKMALLTSLLGLFLIVTGCENGPKPLEKKQVEIINDNNYDGFFFVKVNPMKNAIYEAKYTGYFERIKDSSSRSVIDSSEIELLSNEDLLLNINKNSVYKINENKVFHDTFSLNKLNEEITKSILQKSQRSAEHKNISVTTINKEEYELNSKKDFHVLSDINNLDSKLETATLMAKNDFCNIWYIDNTDTVELTDLSTFELLAQKFARIYKTEVEILGTHKYQTKFYDYFIDPSEKINIIVYDINYDSKADQNYGVFGLFYNADCYKQSSLDEQYKSNETQCIYVDSYFLSNYQNMTYSTLAHEFNHLLNFCQKTITHGVGYSTWFTEMLAMLAEDMCQNILDISDKDSPKGRLIDFIRYHNYGFTTIWNMSSEDETIAQMITLSSYANTYAYGAYLVRNFGGFELLKDLATSQYVDEEAIDYALKNSYNKENEKINSFRNSSFYFHQVFLDLIFTNPNSYYSFNKKITYQDDFDIYFDAISPSDEEKSFIFENVINSIDEQKVLGANGFSIHDSLDFQRINFVYYVDYPLDWICYKYKG